MYQLDSRNFVLLLVLFIALLTVFPCTQMVSAKGPPEPTAGNCLSTPVIWSDGVTKALRGVYGSPEFFGDSYDPDGTPNSGDELYYQQDFGNRWQAQSLDASAAKVDVTWIDWGDNLEAVDWSERSKVRVELVLWQDITLAPMKAFETYWISGEGKTEMWGTNKVEYDSVDATVYSGCARLTIQKLTKDYTDPTLSLAWDAATGEWLGDAEPAQFNGGVWAGGDGPAYYSAEINVSGKCIYGYNWDVRNADEGVGSYRLTFSLEPDSAVHNLNLNTFFTDGITTIMEPEPEEPVAEAEPIQGGVAAIDFANNLTYIDIHIVEHAGGGNGGGKKGGGKR